MKINCFAEQSYQFSSLGSLFAGNGNFREKRKKKRQWLITLILIQCTPFDFRGRIVLWAAFDKLL